MGLAWATSRNQSTTVRAQSQRPSFRAEILEDMCCNDTEDAVDLGQLLRQFLSFSEKSDVWSFSASTWELLVLASEMQYWQETDDKAVACGVTSGALRLSQPDGADDELRLWRVAAACMCSEPAERPDFSELLLQLQDHEILTSK